MNPSIDLLAPKVSPSSWFAPETLPKNALRFCHRRLQFPGACALAGATLCPDTMYGVLAHLNLSPSPLHAERGGPWVEPPSRTGKGG